MCRSNEGSSDGSVVQPGLKQKTLMRLLDFVSHYSWQCCLIFPIRKLCCGKTVIIKQPPNEINCIFCCVIIPKTLCVQSTLSAMHLSRLHSSTRAPVTARVLLRRSSSRRLLPSPQEAAAVAAAPEQRRPSLIPTIPETVVGERRGAFRRRNVMSLVSKHTDVFCFLRR